MKGTVLLVIPVLLIVVAKLSNGQIFRASTINVAAGKPITATATCGVGLNEPELYCKLASVPGKFGIRGLKCDRCNPKNSYQDRNIKFAVDGSEKWWQSPPLSRGLDYQKVNITIDLGQEYQIAYVVIKTGNAPRPGLWSLLRSVDGGKTFTPWQHFAASRSECRQYFGIESLVPLTQDDSVKCSTEYSRIPPFENGEIHISLGKGRPGFANFSYSPVLQQWTRATHIRLQFRRVKTLLADLLPLAREDPTVTRRYFYSIKDISVGAICMCNGHAAQCVESQQDGKSEFVCQCKQNTCGAKCDRCCPFFVQKKWSPGKPCEACNCHRHSRECRYDPVVDANKQSLDLNNKYEGGGVCINCQHNTAGINCEQCKPGYYNPTGVPKTSPDACRPCNCNARFSSGRCYPGTGNCECTTANYGGPRCDRCSEGYYGFPDCRPCDCNPAGTTGSVCGPTGNQCPCKPNFAGNKCDRCADGYYGYPECRRCNCDTLGAYDRPCNPNDGQCYCRKPYVGRQCNQCDRGFYSYPQCKPCNCDWDGTGPRICDPLLGKCICLDNFSGENCDKCNVGYYKYPDCKNCGCSPEGSESLACDDNGVCKCKPNYIGNKCDQCSYGFYDYPRCIKCACDMRGSRHNFCDLNTGECTCKGSFRGQNCNQCRSGFYGFPDCKACQCNPAGIKPIPGRRLGDCSYSNNGQCDCKDNVQGLECTECKTGYYNLRADNPKGCDSCFCDRAGVASGLANCDERTGECTCKQHVTGSRCDTCKVGYFGLEERREFGCTGCNCDVGGSYDQVCDAKTGQCKCRPNVEGLDCSKPVRSHYFPDLLHVKVEVEDGCVPSTANGIKGRDVPGKFQSDSSWQGDESVNCQPVRFGFDDKEFPGYSWKGYVGFTDLQKKFTVTLEVPKTGRYHIIFKYVLNQTNAVDGQVVLSPLGQGAKQSSPVTFKSTQVGSTFTDGYAIAGVNGVSSQFMLTKGTWELTFTGPPSKLLLDYISTVPQQYYQAGILQHRVNNPCIVDGQDPLCIQYSYLNTIRPDFVTVELEKGYIITRQFGRQQTHVFDDARVLEQLAFKEMAHLDRTQTRVTEDINIVKPGKYVLIMQYYHPSDQVKTLGIYLRSRKIQQQKGTFYLHSCRFKFGCRQVALDDNRKLKVFEANEIERRVITLLINEEDTSVAVDSVTAIPLEKWNLDYVVPRPLCTTKDNQCIGTSYPFPKGSQQFDATPDGSKPPPNILDPSKKLKFVQGPSTLNLVGTIPKAGKYSIVIHYYQPNHAGFSTSASITSDQVSRGRVQFDHCPNVEGCRTVIESYDRTKFFDLGRLSASVQLDIPQDKSVWIDYALLIPEGQYTQDVVDTIPLSFSKDFIKDCVQDGYFIKLSSPWPGVCTKPVFSLTTGYNNGTLPCNCNQKGSQSIECNKFGGQCECKPNVIGRECNRCKTGYYGFPNCKKCKCVFCNEVTGACDCPPYTVGKNCEECLKGTYGYDPIRGCQDCQCDISGVRGSDVSCDVITGKCPCKPSRTGQRCNECAVGRFGYPLCTLCDCDERGVLSNICDSNGACSCKPNVVGPRCDKCATGFYNLDANNPDGCTSCWCSGLSKVCSSSKLQRFRIREMRGWAIQNTDAPVEDSGLNEITVSVAGKRTDPEKPVYWIAPKEYADRKVYSYGGMLTYSIRYQVPVEIKKPVLTEKPDVIIKGKNGLTLAYQEQQKISPYLVYNMRINLHEKNWTVGNHSSITRAEFMSVLADIESLKIRASYSTSIADTSLINVYMDYATNIPGQPFDVKSVEQCVCPVKAAGSSCDLCGRGYTRGADNKTCVPCQCNGHSAECDPETGECYNCLHNTTGDRCQECTKGFYGDPSIGSPNDCQLCKCPLGISSNSFASECKLDDQNKLICTCEKGYTGDRCAECEDGYYGDPTVPDDYCKPCQCHGNIDPQVPGSCDPYTGKCSKCINKAVGDHCERCRDGYYGDAVVAKNCQKCKCDACGTVTTLCNYTTGACQCKKNVIGSTCNQCKINTWNFNSCLGCEDCNCGNASLDVPCDTKTGQCFCKLGATGRKCDRCQAGFWNYQPEGCQECNCPKDKDNMWGFCDVNTGQCCKPGDNCTICPPNYILTRSGCEYCGECVGRLLKTATGLDSNISRVLDYLKRGAAGIIAEGKLKDLNDTINKLIPPTNLYTSTMESVAITVGLAINNKTAVPLPFARYPFSASSGGLDSSNNHPSADVQVSSYTESPNGLGAALLEGNGNSYIAIRGANFNTGRYTSILVWIKPEGQTGPILHFGFNRFRLWYVDNVLEVSFKTASGPNIWRSPAIEANKWHHIALIYDGDEGLAQMYINENLMGEDKVGTGGLNMGGSELRIGVGKALFDYFSGAISCLQIFDEPLDIDQITMLKSACNADFVQPPISSTKSLKQQSRESKRMTHAMENKLSTLIEETKDSTMKATMAKTDAFDLEQDIRDALNMSRNIINLAGGIADTLKSGSANQSMLLKEAEEILKELQDRDFTDLNETVNKELDIIASVADTARMLLNETIGLYDQAAEAKEMIAELKKQFMGLLETSLKILDNVTMAEKWNEKSKQYDYMTQIKEAETKKEVMQQTLNVVQDTLSATAVSVMNATASFESFNGSFARLDDLIRQVYDRFDKLLMMINELQPLAGRAGNHSEVLRKQAKVLEDLLEDTKQFSEKALNASKAYSNIAAKLNEALAIARQAEGNATQAQEKAKHVGDRAKMSNENSRDILNRSIAAKDRVEGNLQDLLDSLKDRIENLKRKIASVELDLEIVNGTFEEIDQHGDMGARAEIAEKNATDSEMVANDAYEIAKKIEDALPELQSLKQDIIDANNNITETEEEMVDAVNKSLNLKARIQVITTKQKEIQDELKTEVLDVIQEIQNMLSVSHGMLKSLGQVMDFTGETFTSPPPPPLSRDSSAFKDIELFIKPRVENALLLYLGRILNTQRTRQKRQALKSCEWDFIAIELKDSKIHVVMCISRSLETLTSEETLRPFKDSETSSNLVSEGSESMDPYYRIHFQLNGGFATLDVQEYISNKKPIKSYKTQKKKITATNPVFHVDPDNNHLLIGGIPDGIQVPSEVIRVNYQGPMDGLKIDFVPVGLWDTEKLIKPKFFFVREAFKKTEENTYQFFGNSFIKRGELRRSIVNEFSFEFKTMQSNGVLLMAVQSPSIYAMVDILNSKLRYSYNMGFGNVSLVHEKIISDGKTHSVNMFEGGPPLFDTFTFQVDGTALADDMQFYSGVVDPLESVEASYVYFGGTEKYPQLPAGIKSIKNFIGCISNIKTGRHNAEDVFINVQKYCEVQPTRYVTMVSSDSFLALKPFDLKQRDMTIAIAFKTKSPSGIILYQWHQTDNDKIIIAMQDGYVVFKADAGGGTVTKKTSKTYNDEKWHFITVKQLALTVSMDVDAEHLQQRLRGNHQMIQTTSDLFVGGLGPSQMRGMMVLVEGSMKTLFGASFRDLTFNGKAISFSEFKKDELNVVFDDEELPESKLTDLIIVKPPTPKPQETPTDAARTQAPTTTGAAETTAAATTSPTTKASTTQMPTTKATTKEMPTTEVTTTKTPTTKATSTQMPTTKAATTTMPTTSSMSTTMMSTTAEPTMAPTTPPFCSPVEPVMRDAAITDYGMGQYSYSQYTNIMKNEVMRKVVGSRTRISLDFRAGNPDGILFYTAAGDADFTTCYMFIGKIKCRFNAGGGPANLITKKTYNDGKWHTLIFNRKRKDGTLKIDGVRVSTGKGGGAQGNVDGLREFYLGGVPKDFSPKRVEDKKSQRAFPGCIRSLAVSSKAAGEPDNKQGTTGCAKNNLETGVHFDNGFIVVDEEFGVGFKKTIMLEIKPQTETALILSAINIRGDFIVLELVKGELIFRMENGNGPAEVRYSPTVKNELCDGQWHRIRIDKNGKRATLTVDNNDEINVIGKGSLQNADIKDPLYLGGVEDGFSNKALGTTERFKGCMRSLVVENTKIQPIYHPVRQTGNVYIGGCPVAPPTGP